MKTALFKDIIRQIRYTFNRFLAIFAIVALGVGFFAGIKATCPDMKETADAYFRQSHLMDYELLSTYGVTEEDVEALKAQPGVSAVMPSYSMDAVLKAESGDVVVKLHSILTDAQTGDPNFLNQPKVIEGRLPEKSGECVVDSKTFAMQQMEIGDTITLDTGTEEEIQDSLRTDTYTIVGKVETPLYLSLERGSSTIGNGEIQLFLMIPQEDFNLEYYTEVYLQVQEMQQAQAYSDEYDELAEKYN